MKKMIALIFTLFIIMSVICIKQYLDILIINLKLKQLQLIRSNHVKNMKTLKNQRIK